MKKKVTMKKVERSKADKAHHAKGVKKGSRKDKMLDRALLKKMQKKASKKR